MGTFIARRLLIVAFVFGVFLLWPGRIPHASAFARGTVTKHVSVERGDKSLQVAEIVYMDMFRGQVVATTLSSTLLGFPRPGSLVEFHYDPKHPELVDLDLQDNPTTWRIGGYVVGAFLLYIAIFRRYLAEL